MPEAGPGATVSVSVEMMGVAKEILLDDVEGSVPRAQEAWTAADLPEAGSVTVEQLHMANDRLARTATG
jgi:hypothetical protein